MKMHGKCMKIHEKCMILYFDFNYWVRYIIEITTFLFDLMNLNIFDKDFDFGGPGSPK